MGVSSVARLLCLSLLVSLMPMTMGWAGVVRDDRGQVVALSHSPQRIVTMIPSLTEIVCGLGECRRLVATDQYSNWPASVVDLPKVGGLDDAVIETIVSLKPDVVILTRSERTTTRLAQLGIATFVLNTERYDDVSRNVVRIAELLGVSAQAAILNAQIQSSVDTVLARAHWSDKKRSPLVYFEVDSAPYAAGEASFIGELLSKLGARNVVSASLGAFPKLNPEFVVRQNPDVIMTLPSVGVPLDSRPGWNTIRAVREHRVCEFTTTGRDLITRPGPRMAQGLELMSDCLAKVAP